MKQYTFIKESFFGFLNNKNNEKLTAKEIDDICKKRYFEWLQKIISTCKSFNGSFDEFYLYCMNVISINCDEIDGIDLGFALHGICKEFFRYYEAGSNWKKSTINAAEHNIKVYSNPKTTLLDKKYLIDVLTSNGYMEDPRLTKTRIL